MNPLQQIDFVFFFLKRKITYGGSYGYNNIWSYVKKAPETDISNQTLLKEILKRLKEDGFITETSSEEAQSVYHITFKGLLFEGYEKESQLSFQQKEIASKIAVGTYKNGKILNRLTWILAIGTSIAAIYYLMEIAKYLGWIPASLK